ncbi:MAG TPA: phage tail protein [Oscillospiraceae bacterium]|nr:phage tail protein [Oscillospiraceae bacterium]
MKQPLKYVNFYKRSLARGTMRGMTCGGDLCVTLSNPLGNGYYITPMFDTMDGESSYNRLVVDADFENAKVEILVGATDYGSVFINDKEVSLEKYFADTRVPYEEKAETLRALSSVRAVNEKDILLHDLSGRYVWVMAAVFPMGEGSFLLRGLRLEFPKSSFTEYFPEIYQDNAFFDKFIAVFQSMYLDVERRVDDIPHLLDYETTPDENVAYLADWLGIDNPGGVYTNDQLRRLIRDNDIYQGAKGTRAALEKIIEMTTGIRPRIVEYFQWSRLTKDESQRELMNHLYGGTSNDFCVILDLTGLDKPLPIDKESLEKIVDSYSVIGIGHRIVFLRRCSHTDMHCYLDVNSCLSTPETASVDGVMLGSHITVG